MSHILAREEAHDEPQIGMIVLCFSHLCEMKVSHDVADFSGGSGGSVQVAFHVIYGRITLRIELRRIATN